MGDGSGRYSIGRWSHLEIESMAGRRSISDRMGLMNESKHKSEIGPKFIPDAVRKRAVKIGAKTKICYIAHTRQ